MKLSHSKREGKGKKMPIAGKIKGGFLDRFKGRTSQIGKEGHLGVVKNTSHVCTT